MHNHKFNLPLTVTNNHDNDIYMAVITLGILSRVSLSGRISSM